MTVRFIAAWQGGFSISTDPAKLNLNVVHAFLSGQSYWARGITLDEVKSSICNSLCYGVYAGEMQVGFASVETDFATFAYLSDVFIVQEFQGKGLSKWLLEVIISHPRLQKLDSLMLMTEDAQKLYEKFGFTPIPGSPGQMERRNPKFQNKNKP